MRWIVVPHERHMAWLHWIAAKVLSDDARVQIVPRRKRSIRLRLVSRHYCHTAEKVLTELGTRRYRRPLVALILIFKMARLGVLESLLLSHA